MREFTPIQHSPNDMIQRVIIVRKAAIGMMSLKNANVIKGIIMTIVLSVTALNTSPPFRFRNTFFNIA
jgi:hypothetical protein